MLLVAEAASAEENGRPKLVLFLSIDQGRAEYLERFRPVLRGGLGRLLDESVVFADTHQDHAVTVTSPGHASLATGLYPSHSGIVSNDWYDRGEKRNVYSVEDRDAPILPVAGAREQSTAGRSPKRLLGTTLGDWLKESSPESKVYSISGKDRSAILLGGKKADGAFWYDPRSGQWVTSRYYASEYPSWVRGFQASAPAEEYFGLRWDPLPVASGLLVTMEIDSSRDGGEGAAEPGFPKSIGRGSLVPDASFYQSLFASPFIESYLLQFAERLVREEKLGTDEATDLLALSFSSVDSVGHSYGPNSRELLDTVLRLDRELESFFAFLDGTIGMSRIAVVLSADHGVAPLPEYRLARGLPAGRVGSDDFRCIQGAGRAFATKFGKGSWFVAPLHFDYDELAARGVSREAAEAFLAKELSACPSVARVWTRSELERDPSWDEGVDPTLALYRHSFYAERSPDLYLQLKRWYINVSRGTTHGSPEDYDTHVPGIIDWPGVKPRKVERRIATVDLPVTLASLLRIATPSGLDGVDRSDLMW